MEAALVGRQAELEALHAAMRAGRGAVVTGPSGIGKTRLVSYTSISGDGRYVAFRSPDTNLVAANPAGTLDVFVFDSQTDALQRIPAEGHHNAGTFWPNPALSGDEEWVAGRHPSRYDIVVYDRTTGTGASVTPISRPGSRYQPAISRSGRHVSFRTDSFDAADPSGQDVYIVDREGTPGGGACTHDFSDVDSSDVFESDICWLAGEGITRGCNPPSNTRFCPGDRVTRGQMAAFLVRALDLTASRAGFDDTVGHVFAGDISRLAEAGITRACNPPANTRFCPDDPVTREQMAAFLRRALG